MFREQLHNEISEIEVPNSEVFEALEKGIAKGRKDKALKRRSKYKLFGTITSVAAAAFIASGLYFLLHKEVYTDIKNPSQNITEAKIDVKQKSIKTPVIKIDLEKERQNLKNAGFLVSRDNLPTNSSNNSTRLMNMDVAYNFSLKDYVYNTDTILKGKVLGIKSFIDENHVGDVSSEVKLLVGEDLSGKIKPGEIFSYVIGGGIISEYDFWRINGNKYNLSESELEASKKKEVKYDAFGTLVYPGDEVYVLVGKNKQIIPSSKEQVQRASLQIQIIGGKIDTNTYFELEDQYYNKELRAMKSVDELHSTLKKMVGEKEKKDYSQEKVRQAAYNSLSKSDQSELSNWESAMVIYLSHGTYFEGVGSEPNLIQVSFTGKKSITVYLKANTLEKYKIINGSMY